jgi:hypothetical protein
MSISIAMVAFGKSAKISRSAVYKHLQATWPSLPAVTASEKTDSTFSFQIGNDSIIYGLMPTPIPWSDLEGPCKSSWLWPEATEKMRGHSSHVIVTVMSERPPVERQTLLTQATASLVATTQATAGVYWGSSTLVMSPEMFCDFANKVMPDSPPLFAWIDFRTGSSKNGQVRGFTTGLRSLGHMELEALDAAETLGGLKERFFGLAGYLLENGPVIKDGDTMGEDEDERIQIVYSDSTFGQEEQVMRLVYESSKQKGSWWRRGRG